MRQREDWSRITELLTNPQVNGTQRVGKSTSIGSAAGPYNYSKNYNPISHITSELISEESNINANSEKELGNECFKQKKFNEAIDCYSRSIALSPTAVSYANRAMTYLKIKRFQEAENDCTGALNLDDRYIKAYSRRSTTRKELGKLKESIEDAEFALRLEPQNPQMKKQYGEVKALYEKVIALFSLDAISFLFSLKRVCIIIICNDFSRSLAIPLALRYPLEIVNLMWFLFRCFGEHDS